MAPPPVNPKFAHFVCVDDLYKLPWAKPYDIKQDGFFGVDDIKAFLDNPSSLPLDGDLKSLNLACTQAEIGLIEQGVKWRYKKLLADTSASPHSTSLFGEIESIKREALARVETLNHSEGGKLGMAERVRSTVIEMELRARNIVKDGSTDEFFGVGLSLVPDQKISPENWQVKIASVHPASSAAAAGILVGDILSAVDGIPAKQLSKDGTFDGLLDPETQMTKGFGGQRNSQVKLSLQRGDQKFDVTLKRNIWSARTLGTPPHLPLWDGEERLFKPTQGVPNPAKPSTKSSDMPSFGCGARPGAKP